MEKEILRQGGHKSYMSRAWMIEKYGTGNSKAGEPTRTIVFVAR